jgi:penicillin-binding protein 1A
VLTLAGIYLYLSPQLPSAETYRHVRLETPLRVLAADGSLMAEFGERRVIPVRFEEVPPVFVKAILDTEDKRFYEHSGVDLITLFNSAIALAANMGEITRGGSTITMQLPRNLGTFSRDQVYIRKFKEILFALKIERELSKDQILELYINAVPFGKRAYGAQAAAYTYYGRPLGELGLAELAMLAGIPQAPTAGNPINGPERAMRRRNVVLTRMLEQRSITPEEYEAAAASPNTARLHERTVDVSAPHAAEWVRQLLFTRLGRDLYAAGYVASTTIDARLQGVANTAVREGLFRYDRRHGYRGPAGRVEVGAPVDANALVAALSAYPLHPGLEPAVVVAVADAGFDAVTASGQTVTAPFELMRWARRYVDVNTRGPALSRPADAVATGDVVYLRALPEGWSLAQPPAIQGALVALEPTTGAVQAMVGGYDFAANQFNHAMQGGRQPGSGFKPFVYSAALKYGVTPASIFLDAPLVFEDETLETTYRPRNDRMRYNGPTRLREALYRSINLVSMRVLLAVGAERVLEYAGRFGFDTSTFPRNTQLAIGGGTMAVSPLQMATAYAAFANGGYLVTPNILKDVRLEDGTLVLEERYPVVCEECAARAAAAPVGTSQDASTAAPEPVVSPASRVIDARNAFIVTTMLQDVIRRGTGRRARELERDDIAGKTGTTNEADNWFNGFQSSLVATAWMGFSDHTPLGDNEYGSTGPLPVWIDFMRVALDGVPESQWLQPPGVVTMKIDPRSGEPAPPEQGDAIFEYFLAEHAPAYRPPAVSADPAADTSLRPVDIF